MRFRLRWIAVLLATVGSGHGLALADVEFDGSIGAAGAAPTRSDPGFSIDYLIPYDERTPEAMRFGARRGTNLFHSLDRIDLLATERATFQAIDGSGNPLSGIERVIARVTSGDPSLIEGVLRSEVMRDATSGADLFLINPAGITFRGQGGLRSQLDLPGSFTASTANFVRFDDGTSLATGSAAPPASLSTAPITGFGFVASPPGTSGAVRFEATEPFEVAPGETLRVVARDIVVTDESALLARGGDLLLAAVGDAAIDVPIDVASWSPAGAPPGGFGEIIVEAFSEVRATDPITPNGPQGRVVLRGGRLVVDDSTLEAGGNEGTATLAIDAVLSESIQARQDARLQVRGLPAAGIGGALLSAPLVEVSDTATFVGVRNINTEGGTFLVEADTLRVSDGATLGTQAFGTGPGAPLVIDAGRVEVAPGGSIQSRAFGSGTGGRIQIDASEVVVDAGAISSVPGASGSGGDIAVTAELVHVVQLGSISADTATSQDAGNISVTADRISLESGGQIRSITEAAGNAGNLDIEAAESLSIIGAGGVGPSGVLARSSNTATGNGGNIRIDAPVVELEGDATISARSLGTGNAGGLTIENADLVRVRANADGIAEISARSFNGTDAGSLRIEADRIEVLGGGQITASTLGTSPAGGLDIMAGDLVVQGQNASGNASGVLSQSNAFSLSGGDAGDVTIALTGNLTVSDGGEISARSRGGGEAGSVEITVDGDIDINDGGSINAETNRGTATPPGGNISLAAEGDVRILRGGSITARSVGDQDAGNISILAGRHLVVTDSAITTDVDEMAGPEAAGGRIALEGDASVALLRSRVTTSVQGRDGDENGGDIDIGDAFVIVNQSEVLARAVFGDGGNIRIVASNYLESADSIVDASSEFGVDGTVVVEAPDTQLKSELDRLPSRFLDASTLLREHCAARVAGRGSFVIAGAEGRPASPEAPLAVAMPLDETASAATIPPRNEPNPLRLAAEDCKALAGMVARQEARP